MAQLNLILNQDEILQLLRDNRDEAFTKLLQESLNRVLLAESEEQLKAKPYERTDDRTDSRNGTRERSLITRIGTIELAVPRHRNIPFHTLIFDNYQRSEAALILTMAEMVVAGVSTKKVSDVMETLCGTTFSKSTVSEACKDLDESVKDFRERKFAKDYLFVMVDATYLKVREDHRIVSKALMIAIGFTEEGHKEIIGFDIYDRESSENWLDFINSLHSRGLTGIRMFTSDAHEGIAYALQKVYPEVPWQRCQAHFTRNIVNLMPEKYKIGIRDELVEMFNCKTLNEARKRRDEILKDYVKAAPDAMKCLDEGFDDAMTVMELPEDMRHVLRTSNHLERLNREIKRRSDVIGIFPNKASILRLTGSLLIEENDRWMTKSRLYYSPSVTALKELTGTLTEIAKHQIDLRAAA
jgi:putative transposase